jgi:hypothetical protein
MSRAAQKEFCVESRQVPAYFIGEHAWYGYGTKAEKSGTEGREVSRCGHLGSTCRDVYFSCRIKVAGFRRRFALSETSPEQHGYVLGYESEGIGEDQYTDNNKEQARYYLENSDHFLEVVKQYEELVQCQR